MSLEMVSLFPVKRGWKPNPKLNGDSIKKSRGRPKKDPEMVTVKPVRLSYQMVEVFEHWKLEYGVKTYDEAIRKRLEDRHHEVINLKKEGDNLRKKAEAQDVEIRSLQEKILVLNVQQESLKRIESRQLKAVSELEETIKHTEEIIEVINR
jgi:hypothetical protein